jgi:hypothetical protein
MIVIPHRAHDQLSVIPSYKIVERFHVTTTKGQKHRMVQLNNIISLALPQYWQSPEQIINQRQFPIYIRPALKEYVIYGKLTPAISFRYEADLMPPFS